MKIKRLALALLTLLALTACTSGDPAPSGAPLPTPSSAPQETPAPQSLVWRDQVFEHTQNAQEEVLLYTGRFLMPGVADAYKSPVWSAIEEFYYSEGQAYLETARETAQLAVDDYEVIAALGYDFTPYAEESYYAVTLQTDELVSVRRTFYSDLGGEFPSGFQFSEVFSLVDGHRLTLAELAPDRPALLEQIRLQAAQREDLKLDRLETAFHDQYFYLVPGSLVVYFQEGDLAPREMGTVEVSIPLDQLEGAAP